jgi:hypothetical protein
VKDIEMIAIILQIPFYYILLLFISAIVFTRINFATPTTTAAGSVVLFTQQYVCA